MLAGNKMKGKDNTLIFIDEIQAYPQLLTLPKFLAQDDKFTYIASGSLLGITLAQTTSIPMGSIRKIRMFPLDFEEFLYANGMNELVISAMRKKFERLEELDEPIHNKMMDLFRKYLLVGGLPDAVNSYLAEKNIQSVREIQDEIHDYYAADASKYDEEKKLKIRRIYDLIPSNMENKKKRVVAQNIENKRGKTFNDYSDEFEYLISAGIALNVQAISKPVFPLIESTGKNLLKLYLNLNNVDVVGKFCCAGRETGPAGYPLGVKPKADFRPGKKNDDMPDADVCDAVLYPMGDGTQVPGSYFFHYDCHSKPGSREEAKAKAFIADIVEDYFMTYDGERNPFISQIISMS